VIPSFAHLFCQFPQSPKKPSAKKFLSRLSDRLPSRLFKINENQLALEHLENQG
jgi:hypothetical protein